MVNQLLVSLVNSVLGTGKATARNNYAYHCPFCNHHKPKLEVNLTENKEGLNPWHCWVCDKKGKTLFTLLKKAGAGHNKLNEAKGLLKTNKSIKDYVKTEAISLPNEFIRLDTYNPNSIVARHALAYLKKRNITPRDIQKYNIGYCKNGKYANMIIIPTYDKDGRLNYFTARSFEKNSYIKYKNPPVSRNIIPNEHLINWRLPIILCEGLFDAIAIKRNAIPLLGKNIQLELMKKIISSYVNKIYVALDKDAIKQALHFCEQLMMEGKEVYFVDLQDKDPSEMGFENFTKLVQNTVPMTYSSLLEHKLAV